MRYVGKSSHLEAVRPGPGAQCFPGNGGSSSPPWSVCPVEGVTAVTVSAGDGDDAVAVGSALSDFGSIPVPVQIDLGTGNDGAGVAVERMPVTVVGGAGNDLMGLGSGGDDAVVLRQRGRRPDRLSPERIDPAVRLPDAVRFDGGAGDDAVQITDFPGAASIAAASRHAAASGENRHSVADRRRRRRIPEALAWAGRCFSTPARAMTACG